MKLLPIGFGNMVAMAHLISIVSPESAPIKRIVGEARERGQLIDATYGRRTRAVIVMDSNHVILSALQPETLGNRLEGGRSSQELSGTDTKEDWEYERDEDQIEGDDHQNDTTAE